MTGTGQAAAVTLVCAVDCAPHPAVAVSEYVVVACGCPMSIKPLAPKVPIPAIVTLTPMPELSITVQASLTVWPPPIVTELGVAVNEFIVGDGQAVTLTVVCATVCAPHAAVAVSVKVVVFCGCGISIKPLGATAPILEIETLSPVPELSVTFHDMRTVCPPPVKTLLGEVLKELTVGGGQDVAVTVVWADDEEPQPTVAFRV